jgi:hypothetical protein
MSFFDWPIITYLKRLSQKHHLSLFHMNLLDFVHIISIKQICRHCQRNSILMKLVYVKIGSMAFWTGEEAVWSLYAIQEI